MLPYRDSRLTYTALGIFFLIVLGYGYYEARGVIFGPSITVLSSVTEVHDPLVTIKGHADRIASLSMNGKTISVTEEGAFEEPYLLNPGYNRIVLDASDKYGRTSRRALEIIYTPSTNSGQAPDITATTTGSMDSTSSPQASSPQAASSTLDMAQ